MTTGKSLLNSMAYRVPQALIDSLFEVCVNRLGNAEASKRLFTRLGITEIGANGELGLIRSAHNDRVIMGMYAHTGKAEGTIVKEFQKFFENRSGTYIDVGANIGLTTIPIARNHLVKCIAFEPEPGNFRFLKLNVEENAKGSTVCFHQAALFNRETTLSLALADGNLGDHRITTSGIQGRQVIEVPAMPLDNFCDQLDGAIAIKVDTQGAEPYVLAGGSRAIARAGLLSLEFCPFLMRSMGGDPNSVVELLSTFDAVAVLPPAFDGDPEYASPQLAREKLLKKLSTALDTDNDYFDILLKRNGT